MRIYKSPYFCRLEDQIDTSERLFDTYPILIYPCRIYDHGPSNRDNRCLILRDLHGHFKTDRLQKFKAD